MLLLFLPQIIITQFSSNRKDHAKDESKANCFIIINHPMLKILKSDINDESCNN